jgi:hypothetical protein
MRASSLLPAAGLLLRRLGGTLAAPLTITIDTPGQHVQVSQQVTVEEAERFGHWEDSHVNGTTPLPENRPPRRGREFSPLEARIMAVVTPQWQTKAQLGAILGEVVDERQPSSNFSILLANLVEREYLESSNRGYRLPS